jgi:hypothetical protein
MAGMFPGRDALRARTEAALTTSAGQEGKSRTWAFILPPSAMRAGGRR